MQSIKAKVWFFCTKSAERGQRSEQFRHHSGHNRRYCFTNQSLGLNAAIEAAVPENMEEDCWVAVESANWQIRRL
jgi:hypothetical protein